MKVYHRVLEVAAGVDQRLAGVDQRVAGVVNLRAVVVEVDPWPVWVS